jgi:ribosomal protein L3 glutamine methyltransferase
MEPQDIPLQELLTLRDWVRWSASYFSASRVYFGHGTDNALDEALELVLATLHLNHDLPDAFLDARLSEAERRTLADKVRRRVEERIPLAYLTGRAYFAGLEFVVDENVLVPRSPMAELIVNEFQPWLGDLRVRSVLDLCCGSGCIGIACAYAFDDALVDLADISPAALEVAGRNIEQHALEDRVRAIRSDVFDDLDNERYDLIVSNPPYVSSAEMSVLPAEYLQEPALGLEAGEDGMEVVSRILAGASDYLNPGGILVVEVGASAGLLLARYPDVPFLWIDLQHGGEGVFRLSADQLTEYRDVFLED